MRPARYQQLVQKAASNALAAITIYNQPHLKFKHETFCILMISAWEALLKARIVQENLGDFSKIEIWENTKTKTGKISKKKVRKKNRSGNVLTISIATAMEIVRQYDQRTIDSNLTENILALIEIRDNAIHLFNTDPNLNEIIYRSGSASTLNMLKALQTWFGVNLEEFGFLPLPIAYYPPSEFDALGLEAINKPQAKLLKFLKEAEAQETVGLSEFRTTVKVQVKFTKVTDNQAVHIRVTRDPTAPEIRLSEEDYLARSPLDHKQVIAGCKSRVPGLKINIDFNSAMKKIERDETLCIVRYLNPHNPKGSRKKFYHVNTVEKIINLMS